MPFRVTRDGTATLSYHQTRPLLKPTRGVRAGSDNWWETVRAFSLVLPPLTAFSHATAATIQNLPLPQEPTLPLHVTTDVTGRRGRRKGLAWHQRRLSEVELWHGLPVTPPLRTWRDLADEVGHEDLVVVADVLLRRGLCSRTELEDMRGVRHAKRLLRAAELADGGSASPQETRTRLALLADGIPAPSLNYHIVVDGVWVGCGDLVWKQYAVIADYDGGHHEGGHQRHQDAQTRDDYVAAGWRHIVLTSAMSPAQAVSRVARALGERGWTP